MIDVEFDRSATREFEADGRTRSDPASSIPDELLANAMAARMVNVQVGDFRLAYTDTDTIFVPEGDRSSVRIGLLVQGALLSDNSLDPSILVRLAAHRSCIRRYLTLEAVRVFGSGELPVPRSVRVLLEPLWTGPIPSSPEESLGMALRQRPPVPDAPDAFGTIKPLRVLAKTGMRRPANPPPPGAASQEKPVPEVTGEDDDDSAELTNKRLHQSLLSGKNLLMRLLGDAFQLKHGRDSTDGDGGGAGTKIAQVVSTDRVGPHATLMQTPGLFGPPTTERSAGKFFYPEWDDYGQRYRSNWCQVTEFAERRDTDHRIARPKIDHRLRRQIAALGLSSVRHRREVDGDDLDTAALVDFAVARRLGDTPDPRVYQTRRRSARDLGVVILLDASESTTANTPNGIDVWGEQCTLTAGLASSFEQVGDRVAVYGFNSRGRGNIRFLRVKQFDSRFDDAAFMRLSQIEPTGFTRLGGAIRHASHIAEEHAGTSHRLIVVVSDGYAYDDGYEGGYAEHDTRRALDEAVARGTGCVCISVASGTDSSTIERIWGSVTHAELDNAADLSTHVGPMFRTALAAADVTSDHRRKVSTEWNQPRSRRSIFRSRTRTTSSRERGAAAWPSW